MSRPISRSAFLKGAAGTLIGAGALATTTGTGVAAAELPGQITTTKVRDLTGPGLTSQYGMAATDLGIPVRLPDGRLFFVFGDTYANVGNTGDWRSPVALYMSNTDLNSGPGCPWSGAVGGTWARQLWPYEHARGRTLLPADLLVVGDTLYLYAMRNESFPIVLQTEIWASEDNGETWENTGARFSNYDPRFGPNYQCITWAAGNDGFVYIFSTRFGRAPTSKLYLSRVPVDDITDTTAYQPWGRDQAGWAWGKPFTPVINEGGFGELCLRPMGGKWVLTYLTVGNPPRIEGIVMNRPTDDLSKAQRHTLVTGVPWEHEDHSTGKVAQPYGGYIIPGSTIGELHLSVSQWRTKTGGNNWPYRSMQFRVTGLPV